MARQKLDYARPVRLIRHVMPPPLIYAPCFVQLNFTLSYLTDVEIALLHSVTITLSLIGYGAA